MVQITITDELAQAIFAARDCVTLVDPRGRKVAQVAPTVSGPDGPVGMTPEHLAKIRDRIAGDDGTRSALADVMDRLRASDSK